MQNNHTTILSIIYSALTVNKYCKAVIAEFPVVKSFAPMQFTVFLVQINGFAAAIDTDGNTLIAVFPCVDD